MPDADNTASSLTLLLMRHAKSDWANENLSDHDRPLNKRGRRDSPRIAQWIAEQDLRPDRVLCSSSCRTRETVSLLHETWKTESDTRFMESLYLGSPETIFRTIANEGDDAARLLVVAHNPGMSQLATAMARQPIEMPTAAVAVFRIDAESWDAFGSDTTLQLTHLIRPKSLG
jgi:phosphohistidine phosphatase